MKKKKGSLFVGIWLMTTVLFFAGCDNSYYSKVSETLYIQNGTDSTIYVEYGFLKSIRPFDQNRTDTVRRYFSSSFQFDDAQVPDLWMSEKDFNKYVSKIKIYRILNGDSIFVSPQYYNTKSAWDYKFYTNGNYEYGIKESQNNLTIVPEMFNQ